jgi:hypothetical protein
VAVHATQCNSVSQSNGIVVVFRPSSRMARSNDSASSPAIVKKLSLREVAQRFEAGDADVLEASVPRCTLLYHGCRGAGMRVCANIPSNCCLPLECRITAR